MNRIGIFGGTFNPVHNAHLTVAKLFVKHMELDACYFVPASVSPFKHKNVESNFLKNEVRLNMLKLALAKEPNLYIEEYELIEGGISYSYKTINYFRYKFPNSELFLLIGTDQANLFKQWKEWKFILENVTLCIVNRENLLNKPEKEKIIKDLTINNREPVFIPAPSMPISSSDIRRKLINKEDVSGLIPNNILEYIKINPNQFK